jgi:hypothetical protein
LLQRLLSLKGIVVNWSEGTQFPAGVHREDNQESSVEEMNVYNEMKGLDGKRLRAKYTNRRTDKKVKLSL